VARAFEPYSLDCESCKDFVQLPRIEDIMGCCLYGYVIDMEKKMKRMGFRITPRMMEYFCKKGTIKIKESPIPEDAKWISTFLDDWTQDFVVIFEHEDFKEIAEGYCVPVFNSNSLMLERKLPKKKNRGK